MKAGNNIFACQEWTKEREVKIKPQTKGIQKLDLTIPARMRSGVFQSLWRGSKGDPSEDVDVTPKESQFFTLAFHKTALGVHHTQLHVVPLRREKSIAQSFTPLASPVASTHTLPCPVPQMDPLTVCLPQPSLWTLVESPHVSATGDVPMRMSCKLPFQADRQQQFSCTPKDKW